MTTTADDHASSEDGPGGGIARVPSPAAPALGRGLVARLAADPLTIATLCIVVGLWARLYGLNLVYTSDEGYWLQRTVTFGNALLAGDYAATARSGHPGVTVMWTGFLGIGPAQVRTYAGLPSASAAAMEQARGAERSMREARTAISALTAGLFGLVVLLAGRLLGPAGLLGGALLALDPYTVGMSRLLHVDALLTPLLLVSLLAGLIYWLQGQSWPFLMLSAVTGGLALLTKAPAITLVPFFGIVWLVLARPWRGNWRSWLAAISWALLVAAVYFALWPALWIRPIEILVAVAQFAVTLGGAPHLWPTYFLGQPTTGDPGLLFYPIAIALRLGPVATVGLVLLAVLGLRHRVAGASTVLWLLVFAIIFVDIMAIGSKKFDRYMLPALAVLTVLAGAGIWALARLFAWRLGAGIVALAVVCQVFWLWSAYPYPLAAYNPLVGGTSVARETIMVGWGEGIEQAAAYLNRLPNAERLSTSTQYHHVLRLAFHGRTVRVPNPRTLDYYVVYVNMIQRNTVPIPVSQAMVTSEPVFTATVNGEPFAWVYRGPFVIATQRDVPSYEEDEVEGPGE